MIHVSESFHFEFDMYKYTLKSHTRLIGRKRVHFLHVLIVVVDSRRTMSMTSAIATNFVSRG